MEIIVKNFKNKRLTF